MSNILSMPDEEILGMTDADRDAMLSAEPAPADVQAEEPQEPVEPAEPVEVQEPVEPEEQEEPQEQQEEDTSVVKEEEEEPTAEEVAASTPVGTSGEQANGSPAKEEPAKPEATEQETADAQLAKLFSSFKASGREFKVNSVEEAVQLMQKGVNYHDKMHGLKPVMGIARMLERNGLLDESKLSYLIDLHNKKPEAIAKLVKESGVDTLEIDDKQVAAYKPTNKGLTSQENELEDALSDLQQYSSHDRVISMVNNQFDQASRKMVLENPHVLLHIASQVDSGVYDVVQAEITKQRILGNLKGVSDLEAYDVVGKALNERGTFNHLNKQEVPAQQQAPVVVPPKPAARPAVSAAKVAAAPAKVSAAKPAPPKAFNPLSMSDEEFLKHHGNPL